MELQTPKLTKVEEKKSIVNYFHEVCQGLTVMMFYAMIWLLLGAVCYRILLWAF